MIDEHLVTMIKEYRNQKNKFSLAVEESDGYTVVDNKRHNKKGKGNDKGKGPAGASSSNDNAQTGKGSNKGGGKGSPAHYPGTKGKSKGKGKGASFPDMPWTDTFRPIKEGFVHGIDSTPADWIKHDDFTQEADGCIFLADPSSLSHWIRLGLYTKGPCAAMLPYTEEQFLRLDKDGLRRSRFRPAAVEMPLAKNEKAAPVQRRVLMVQLGKEDVSHKPNYARVARPVQAFATTSISVYKNMTGAQTFPSITTPKGYKEHCMSHIGKDVLYCANAPVKTIHKTDMLWQDQVQEVQMGWAHIITAKLTCALRKSGKNGTFINDLQGRREGKYFEIKLPRNLTLAEALAISDKLGSTSLGIVTTAGGFALRVLIEDELKAKAMIDPAFAQAVGPVLMNTATTDKNRYVIKNIDKHIPFIDIVKTLQASGSGIGVWHVKPLYHSRNPENGRGQTDVVVVALGPPSPGESAYALFGNTWLRISRYEPAHLERPNMWSKTFDRDEPTVGGENWTSPQSTHWADFKMGGDDEDLNPGWPDDWGMPGWRLPEKGAGKGAAAGGDWDAACDAASRVPSASAAAVASNLAPAPTPTPVVHAAPATPRATATAPVLTRTQDSHPSPAADGHAGGWRAELEAMRADSRRLQEEVTEMTKSLENRIETKIENSMAEMLEVMRGHAKSNYDKSVVEKKVAEDDKRIANDRMNTMQCDMKSMFDMLMQINKKLNPEAATEAEAAEHAAQQAAAAQQHAHAAAVAASRAAAAQQAPAATASGSSTATTIKNDLLLTAYNAAPTATAAAAAASVAAAAAVVVPSDPVGPAAIEAVDPTHVKVPRVDGSTDVGDAAAMVNTTNQAVLGA